MTLRMQGVSWPSLSCEESLERSLERRRSRERSQPPLAPCRLIFLCSASTRDVRARLLLFKTKAYLTFLSLSQGQRIFLFRSCKVMTHTPTHVVHTISEHLLIKHVSNTVRLYRKYNDKKATNLPEHGIDFPYARFNQAVWISSVHFVTH